GVARVTRLGRPAEPLPQPKCGSRRGRQPAEVAAVRTAWVHRHGAPARRLRVDGAAAEAADRMQNFELRALGALSVSHAPVEIPLFAKTCVCEVAQTGRSDARVASTSPLIA